MIRAGGAWSARNHDAWSGKSVFITGVCGTVGRELLASLCSLDVRAVVGIDINETELFFMRERVRSDTRVQLLLCDIRMPGTLSRSMAGADIVLHAAAYKHVEICERSPTEAVLTNIVGTQNVVAAAFENAVERVLFTSSDKAVNPTNVMGTSKLMAERLMTAAGECSTGKPIFSSIRFGNVLGSRGSVVPLFTSQILEGGPVTLTDRAMTRFVMSIEQAARLVMDATLLAIGGAVIVTKMPALRIADLATFLIDELAPRAGRRPEDVAIQIVGCKPGEKLYEELTNEEEVRRTFDWEEYLIVKPALSANGRSRFHAWESEGRPAVAPYNSAHVAAMKRDEIKAFFEASYALA